MFRCCCLWSSIKPASPHYVTVINLHPRLKLCRDGSFLIWGTSARKVLEFGVWEGVETLRERKLRPAFLRHLTFWAFCNYHGTFPNRSQLAAWPVLQWLSGLIREVGRKSHSSTLDKNISTTWHKNRSLALDFVSGVISPVCISSLRQGAFHWYHGCDRI